ncbi:MAG: hypothetical protein ABSG96_23010 [Terracidiphilus sp.]
MKQNFVPVEVSFKQWKKDPKYGMRPDRNPNSSPDPSRPTVK